jgi:hypothetical protein
LILFIIITRIIAIDKIQAKIIKAIDAPTPILLGPPAANE